MVAIHITPLHTQSIEVPRPNFAQPTLSSHFCDIQSGCKVIENSVSLNVYYLSKGEEKVYHCIVNVATPIFKSIKSTRRDRLSTFFEYLLVRNGNINDNAKSNLALLHKKVRKHLFKDRFFGISEMCGLPRNRTLMNILLRFENEKMDEYEGSIGIDSFWWPSTKNIKACYHSGSSASSENVCNARKNGNTNRNVDITKTEHIKHVILMSYFQHVSGSLSKAIAALSHNFLIGFEQAKYLERQPEEELSKYIMKFVDLFFLWIIDKSTQPGDMEYDDKLPTVLCGTPEHHKLPGEIRDKHEYDFRLFFPANSWRSKSKGKANSRVDLVCTVSIGIRSFRDFVQGLPDEDLNTIPDSVYTKL